MTKLQEKTINRIKQRMISDLLFNANKYEIKKWEVEELLENKIVSIVGETGLKGDEGTLASVICRNRFHLFVGPKGGISYYNKKGTKKHLKKYEGLLTISLQQF